MIIGLILITHECQSFRKQVVSPLVVLQTPLVSSQMFRSQFANVIKI